MDETLINCWMKETTTKYMYIMTQLICSPKPDTTKRQ